LSSHISTLLMLLFTTVFIFFACKDPGVEKKIDANLRLQLTTLKQTSQLDQNISVVFKTNEALTDLHKTVLQKQGINITANIGNIYTAKLPASSLYDLAKMKFVESIQGSRQVKIHPVDSLEKIHKF